MVWLADNDTTDWTVGIKFVRFQKNSAHHSGINCSPYSAMFGCEAMIGFTFSALPTEVIATTQNEDDLVAALTSSSSQFRKSPQQKQRQMTQQYSTVQIPVPSTSSAVPDREAVNTGQNAVPSTSSAVPGRKAVNTAQNAAVPSTSSAVPDRDDDEAAQQTLAYRTT